MINYIDECLVLQVLTGTYRNNASKRPPRVLWLGTREKAAQGVCYVAEAFSGKKISGLLPPRGDAKRIAERTHSSHTPSNNPAAAKDVLVMSQPSSTGKAPSTDKNIDDTNSWGSLRRSGQAAATREGTPAPGPAPSTAPAAQQVLQRGPLPRLFTLRGLHY